MTTHWADLTQAASAASSTSLSPKADKRPGLDAITQPCLQKLPVGHVVGYEVSWTLPIPRSKA